MKKRYLAIGGLFVLVVTALYVIGGMVISKIAVVGVEAFFPQVTKTSVGLEGLRLSPLSGSGTMTGFVLGNPEGYTSDFSSSKGGKDDG